MITTFGLEKKARGNVVCTQNENDAKMIENGRKTFEVSPRHKSIREQASQSVIIIDSGISSNILQLHQEKKGKERKGETDNPLLITAGWNLV